MIKTIATPKQNTYSLAIPNDYIGKEIEILFYTLDELKGEKQGSANKKSMADYCGVLSESDYQSIKSHTEQARKEWNRPI